MNVDENEDQVTGDTAAGDLPAEPPVDRESLQELKNIIEAALLASEVPLSTRKLMNLFPQETRPDRKAFDDALKMLADQCAESSLDLSKIDKGWRLQTKEKYAPWLRKLRESRPPRYSRALLETLAIIAYRQPVSRADIENIRGVSVTTDMMRTLIDREWISQVGYRDVPGRPALWGTTKVFLEYFNLGALSELPALHEQRDMSDIAKELNITLPLEQPPAADDANVLDETDADHDDSEAVRNEAEESEAEESENRVEAVAKAASESPRESTGNGVDDTPEPFVDDIVSVDDDHPIQPAAQHATRADDDPDGERELAVAGDEWARETAG